MSGLLLAADVDYMLYKFAVAVGARGWCWSQLQGSVVEALYYEVVALEFNQVGVEWHAGRGVKTALCMVLNAVWHAASGTQPRAFWGGSCMFSGVVHPPRAAMAGLPLLHKPTV